MRWLVFSVLCVLLVMTASCFESLSPTAGDGDAPGAMTRDEARRVGGKLDGWDLCDLFGWYGDGLCDTFCDDPDPDCDDDEQVAGVGEPCGGISLIRCDEDLVCSQADLGGCAIDAGGICVEQPPIFCTEIWAPVCGCDDVTYSNDCHRRAAHVAPLHAGECEGTRHCYTNEDCDGAQVCDFSDASGCGGTGHCVSPTPPIYCALYYSPVCGCDGVTYGNDCERVDARMALDYDGPCAD